MIKRENLDSSDSAERYGVKEFDLAKKAELLNLAKPIIASLQKEDGPLNELQAFRAGVNALHFNRATGLLVSENEAVRIFRRLMGQSYELNNSFENFISANRPFLYSVNKVMGNLPSIAKT